ncbi:MAG: hypothetical protein WD894_07065 [Pirellulales bacterium]
MKIFTRGGLFARVALLTANRRSAKSRHNRPFVAGLRVEVLEDRTMLSAGALDPSFGIGGRVVTDFGSPSDFGEAVVVQADGKTVVAGSTSNEFAVASFAVARYNADGSLDASFGSNGRVAIDFGSSRAVAHDVELQQDGKIILAGASFHGGGSDFGAVRLNPDGSLDDTFGSGGKLTIAFTSLNDEAFGITVQSDGKILVTGASLQDATERDFAAARLNADGSLDNTFGTGGKLTIDFGFTEGAAGFAEALELPDGRIVVATSIFDPEPFRLFGAVARLTSIGELDSSFGSGGTQTIDFIGSSMALQTDGKIVIAGYSDQGATGLDVAVTRLNGDGSLDHSFGGDGKQTIDFDSPEDYGDAVAVQTDGKLIVAGSSYQSAIGYDFAVARLNSDGSLDDLFAHGGKQTIDFGSPDDTGLGVALQADGNIVVAGYAGYASSEGGNDYDFAVVRLLGGSNAGPAASAGGSYTVVQGGSVQLDGSATNDPDQSNTTLAYEWDFDGDGFYDDATDIAPTFSAVGYEGPITLSVAVRVTDDGGLTDVATTSVSIVPFAMQADPCDPTKTALVVGGTLASDSIVFNPGATAGEVAVSLNGASLGTFQPTGRLIVYAQAGDDDVQVAGSLGLIAELHGQAGDDRIKGGAGHDILLGGDGDDLLVGGGGRDLLIGGTGADRIVGNADDDILIAGSTAYDEDHVALSAIMAEWTSAGDYTTRTANLASTFSGLSLDDGTKDVLTGSSGQDWFFANLEAGVLDKITDLSADEFEPDMDFILSE